MISKSEYEKKLADLSALLNAEGIDAEDFIRRAGLRSVMGSSRNSWALESSARAEHSVLALGELDQLSTRGEQSAAPTRVSLHSLLTPVDEVSESRSRDGSQEEAPMPPEEEPEQTSSALSKENAASDVFDT